MHKPFARILFKWNSTETKRMERFQFAHPHQAELLVEIADSSLHYDRTVKNSLYAKAGIVEYWIVNLVDGQLEVYRQPIPDPDAEYGFRYAEVRIYQSGEQVTPQALSAGVVAIDDLLP